MSVAFLNDSTVTNFINDTQIFVDCVKENFKKLDKDKDGVLSQNELRVGFRNMTLEFDSTDVTDDLSDVVFQGFNVGKNGGIDEEMFKSLLREILLAVAHGIGNLPVQVALQQDSLLMKAVEHERAKERK